MDFESMVRSEFVSSACLQHMNLEGDNQGPDYTINDFYLIEFQSMLSEKL